MKQITAGLLVFVMLATSIALGQDLEEINRSSRALTGALEGLPENRVAVVRQYIPSHGLHFTVTLPSMSIFTYLDPQEFADVPETLQALAPTVRGLAEGDAITVAVVQRSRPDEDLELVFRLVGEVVEIYLNGEPFGF